MNLANLASPLASTEAERNGVEKVVGGITFRIKPFGEGNREAMALMVKLHQNKVKNKGAKKDDFEDEIIKNIPQILAVIVVGWKGMKDSDGTAIKYSRKTALELFTMHSKLAQAVFTAASELNVDDSIETEEEAGN